MKKSRQADYVHLAVMRDAVSAIKSYTRGGARKFYKAKLVQDAVIYQLGLLGEAASRVNVSTRRVLDDVPWKSVIQNRQYRVHPLAAVSLREVWKTVSKLVPQIGITLNRHSAR